MNEEMKAISEISGIPYHDIFMMNFLSEIGATSCTSIVAQNKLK